MRKYPIIRDGFLYAEEKQQIQYDYVWSENDRIFTYNSDDSEITVRTPKNIEKFLHNSAIKGKEIFQTDRLRNFPRKIERLTYNILPYANTNGVYNDDTIYVQYGRMHRGIDPSRIYTHQATVNPGDLIWYGDINRHTFKQSFDLKHWPIIGVYSRKLSGWVIFNGNHRVHIAQILGVTVDIYSIDYSPWTNTLDKVILKDYHVYNPYTYLRQIYT